MALATLALCRTYSDTYSSYNPPFSCHPFTWTEPNGTYTELTARHKCKTIAYTILITFVFVAEAAVLCATIALSPLVFTVAALVAIVALCIFSRFYKAKHRFMRQKELEETCKSGKAFKAKQLINAGEDGVDKSSEINFSLLYACRSGLVDVAKLLLDLTPKCIQCNNGNTLLHKLLIENLKGLGEKERLDIVRFLAMRLKQENLFNQKNTQNMTVIDVATAHQDPSIVACLQAVNDGL